MAEIGATAAATESEEKAKESNEEYSSEGQSRRLVKETWEELSQCLIKGLKDKLRYPG